MIRTSPSIIAMHSLMLVGALAVVGCERKEAAAGTDTPPAAAQPAPAPESQAAASQAGPPAAGEVAAPTAGPAATPAATPTAGQTATPASAPAAAPAQPVLATQEFSEDPSLRAEVLEVKRVSGPALLIKWRLARVPAAGGSGLEAQPEAKPTHHQFSWSDVYFTEASENKKYFGLKDSAGGWIGQGENKNYTPGQQQVMWLKFPAPPETSTKITFVFPGFAPFEDLTIS